MRVMCNQKRDQVFSLFAFISMAISFITVLISYTMAKNIFFLILVSIGFLCSFVNIVIRIGIVKEIFKTLPLVISSVAGMSSFIVNMITIPEAGLFNLILMFSKNFLLTVTAIEAIRYTITYHSSNKMGRTLPILFAAGIEQIMLLLFISSDLAYKYIDSMSEIVFASSGEVFFLVGLAFLI